MKRLQQFLIDKNYDLGSWGADGQFGNASKEALTKYLKVECVRRGYIFFQTNLYWLRMSDNFTDQMSDYVAVVCAGRVVEVAKATTKPGKYWVSNPVTVGGIKGTGCQKEGQYIGSHEFVAEGKSKWGGYGYFKQISKIDVYRDGNKDNKLDKNIVTKAPSWYGFFLHAMGSGRRVWNWSAGCCGTSLADWRKKIVPWFDDGQTINNTIIDVCE